MRLNPTPAAHAAFLVFAAAVAVLSAGAPAFAQHTWTVNSTSPGVSVQIGMPEWELMSGPPWNADGIAACPPQGVDDTQCDWLTFVNGDSTEYYNGVMAYTLDGSAAGQNGVVTSDVWPDSLNSTANWIITYDVYFAAVNPADIASLRLVSRYKYNGTTMLTLTLAGQASTSHFQFRVSPTHSWVENPETGPLWTIEVTASRSTAGSPVMIWMDKIHVVESSVVHYDEQFPVTMTGVAEQGGNSAAGGGLALSTAPNPVRGESEVSFALPDAAPVRVEVFDVRGERVRSLASEEMAAGAHRVAWDGRDEVGRPVGAGIYLVRVEAGARSAMAKVLRVE